MAFQFRPLGKRRSRKHVDGSALWQVDPLISLQDVAGQVELPLVARDSIQFDQRHLDFRMSRHDRPLRSSTIVRDQEVVNKSNTGLNQLTVARTTVIRNCTLQQVTYVVQFVPGRLGLWL